MRILYSKRHVILKWRISKIQAGIYETLRYRMTLLFDR